MKTKSFLTVTMLIITGTASFSQSHTSRFGLHAGASLANFRYKDDGMSVSPKSIFGLQTGLVVDYQINKQFSFQPGLNFVQKGTKSEDKDYDQSMVARLNCIEIPLNFLYRATGSKGNFFVGGGPSLSFAISGKFTEEFSGQKETEKIEIGDDEMEDDIRGLDFGINVMAGYEFRSGIFIAANYNLGLRNLTPGGSSDYKVNSSYAGLRIGYFFNKK